MFPRVLIVEPHADLCASIAATLRREHYTCATAATADDARIALRRANYEFVIVDLHDAAAIGPVTSQLILLTESDLYARGDVATLRKPFGRDELMARLAS
jgi:ActR/RegA family two-component response regulator